MKLSHPYTTLTDGAWCRGNLHTHTTQSDGQRSRQAVIDDYAARGYDFLMISDHDFHTSLDDYAALDARGLVLIPGNEITANGKHLLHVNGNQRIEPDEDRQAVMDAVNRTQGFVIVNHPNWQREFDYCSFPQLQQWQGYTGIEIYNGTIGRLPGSPYATNKWDQLLTAGRRVWGFANDDSHLAEDDVGLGWNMVYASERSLPAIVEAIQQGRFYASTGVTIQSITVTGNRIRVATENAERIVALRDDGVRFAQVDDRAIEVDAPAEASYVRFECWGRGEQFAWTQPFFIQPE